MGHAEDRHGSEKGGEGEGCTGQNARKVAMQPGGRRKHCKRNPGALIGARERRSCICNKELKPKPSQVKSDEDG